ncbi:hypothetical protein B5F76_11420 [Desulfovibrio sp. An276]|uniref:polysaccharide pyruvyl transferase family protein n=1 Tax=Desulfovibrio sp. An276 TaxID=1965618 RepID=UPI000B3687B6|nr:polysaccharide pyruvyl transferase family protein [Desulfovibrio sp. An276]OUO50550.1 hypothetical protein B5F76_11420 [Desulfovibrio sp. An276]
MKDAQLASLPYWLSEKSIGMILYASDNYGSCATNFALCKVIEEFGYTPVLLDSYVPLQGVSAKYLLSHFHYIGEILQNDCKISDLNDLFNCFILGSDYSLNIEASFTAKYIDYFLMAFADDTKKKLAYAPCLGKPDVEHDPCLRYLYARLLQRFQLVTFREKSAVELCGKFFGRPSYQVLDPVFLVDSKVFYRIVEESQSKVDMMSTNTKAYLLAYILDYTFEKQKLIEKTADNLGLDYRIILDSSQYAFFSMDSLCNPKIVSKPTFEEWLCLIAKASFVVTDSFHGTCFALYFHKNYISLKNRNTSRFDSLVYLLKHENESRKVHIYASVEDAMNDLERLEKLNFSFIDSCIVSERIKCKQILSSALSMDVSNDFLAETPREHNDLIHYVDLWKRSYFQKLNSEQFLLYTPLKSILRQRIKRYIWHVCSQLKCLKIIDLLFPKYTARRQYMIIKIKKFLRI